MNKNLNSEQNHVTALAGLMQACALVNDLARTAQCDTNAFHASLNSLLTIDIEDIGDVFGHATNLQYGLKTLQNQLDKQSKPAMAITQYAVSLMHLQKRLQKNSKMTALIASELQTVQEQLKHFDITHTNIVAKFADIYQRSISQLGPRILIRGDETILRNTTNAEKIRALLLAGIRSAVLFSQCKGSKFKLLLKRKRYLEITNQLLETVG